MKKIMEDTTSESMHQCYSAFFSGTYPKIVESDQKSSLVAPPCHIMSLRTNALV